MTGEELSTKVKEVWVSARSRGILPEDTILIKHPEKRCLGESRKINKSSLVSQITGYKTKIAAFKDDICMKSYLEKIPKSTLTILKIATLKEFLPESAPLLDFLVAESKAPEGWKYPLQEELEKFQEQRGLSYDMLDLIEVREIVTGVSTKKEIIEIHDWVTNNYLEDQAKFGSKVVSMDVEDVTVSYYNLMRMSDQLPIIENQIIL